MSRALILSDIHHRHARAQSIIDKVPHDELVLLGDYFDNKKFGIPSKDYYVNAINYLLQN